LTVLTRRDMWINSFHVVCGALVLTTSLVITLRSWRARFAPPVLVGSDLRVGPSELRVGPSDGHVGAATHSDPALPSAPRESTHEGGARRRRLLSARGRRTSVLV